MKLITFLSTAVVSTAAFSPVTFVSKSTTLARIQTSIGYTIIGGIDDEEPEIDPNSVQAAALPPLPTEARSTSAVQGSKFGPGDLSGYSDSYDEKEAADLNVDAFSNEVTGGVMPGFQLSSLCGDD